MYPLNIPNVLHNIIAEYDIFIPEMNFGVEVKSDEKIFTSHCNCTTAWIY